LEVFVDTGKVLRTVERIAAEALNDRCHDRWGHRVTENFDLVAPPAMFNAIAFAETHRSSETSSIRNVGTFPSHLTSPKRSSVVMVRRGLSSDCQPPAPSLP
jgi:hypothetical protein